MKALLKRLQTVNNEIKNNSKHYDKFNMALLKYEKIQLMKRIIHQEEILKAINTPGSSIYIEKVGKYDDGKEFIIIKIDNL
jgi:hypothetical protein